MAAKHGIAGLIYEIRVPVLLAVLWAVLGLATESVIPSGSTIDALWLTVRVAFVAAAGFLATRSGRFGLLAAAFAGAIVVFADHVIVKGVTFLAMGEFLAAGGVVVSYFMFIWVEMSIGLGGGVVGKLQASRVKERAAI